MPSRMTQKASGVQPMRAGICPTLSSARDRHREKKFNPKVCGRNERARVQRVNSPDISLSAPSSHSTRRHFPPSPGAGRLLQPPTSLSHIPLCRRNGNSLKSLACPRSSRAQRSWAKGILMSLEPWYQAVGMRPSRP